jgi:hypothetical protein
MPGGPSSRAGAARFGLRPVAGAARGVHIGVDPTVGRLSCGRPPLACSEAFTRGRLVRHRARGLSRARRS